MNKNPSIFRFFFLWITDEWMYFSKAGGKTWINVWNDEKYNLYHDKAKECIYVMKSILSVREIDGLRRNDQP